MTITAEQFRNAFASAWSQWKAENWNTGNSSRAAEYYGHDATWTSAMLKGEGALQGTTGPGVLPRTFRELLGNEIKTRVKAEWYTIDRLIVSGNDLFEHEEGLLHPSHLDVLIEHENREDWEVEMWKLLFWRAPLKVLIGYDYNDDELEQYSKSGNSKGDWLREKIAMLHKMYSEVRQTAQVTDLGQYLLIAGNRSNSEPTSPVKWRWCLIDEPTMKLTEFA